MNLLRDAENWTFWKHSSEQQTIFKQIGNFHYFLFLSNTLPANTQFFNAVVNFEILGLFRFSKMLF